MVDPAPAAPPAADARAGRSEALLARPPEEGARLLALGFLDQAAAARPRLRSGGDDAEALHDFRVGLRRLRSCLQAYAGPLGDGVPKKLARRLKRLAGSTGAGRDTEVQIEWLRAQAPVLGSFHRSGLRWLLARLEARREAAYRSIEERAAGRFDELAAALRERLSVYTAEVRLDRGEPERRETLGAATAVVLERDVAELRARLAAIDGAGDVDRAHRARIAAKRLRYLLEPLADELAPLDAATRPLVKRVKGLQELLGELHDAHILADELAAALAAAAEERAAALLAATLAPHPDAKLLRAEQRRGREAGLLALARLNRERRERVYREVADGWLDGRSDDLLDEVAGLGRALADS